MSYIDAGEEHGGGGPACPSEGPDWPAQETFSNPLLQPKRPFQTFSTKDDLFKPSTSAKQNLFRIFFIELQSLLNGLGLFIYCLSQKKLKIFFGLKTFESAFILQNRGERLSVPQGGRGGGDTGGRHQEEDTRGHQDQNQGRGYQEFWPIRDRQSFLWTNGRLPIFLISW